MKLRESRPEILLTIPAQWAFEAILAKFSVQPYSRDYPILEKLPEVAIYRSASVDSSDRLCFRIEAPGLDKEPDTYWNVLQGIPCMSLTKLKE